jgi:hypothetical protein
VIDQLSNAVHAFLGHPKQIQRLRLAPSAIATRARALVAMVGLTVVGALRVAWEGSSGLGSRTN